jgi:hypothetical protein
MEFKMKKNSIIRKTGQWRKWQLGQGMQLAGWGLMFFSGAFHFFPKDNTDLQVLLSLIGTVFVLSGMIFLWASIKCPLCKSKWLWVEASQRDIFNFKKWGPSMPDYEVCPLCENTGTKKHKKVYEI